MTSNPNYATGIVSARLAAIEGDLDAAVEYYRKAVHAAEPAVVFWDNDTCFLNQVFPEFVAYPPISRFSGISDSMQNLPQRSKSPTYRSKLLDAAVTTPMTV